MEDGLVRKGQSNGSSTFWRLNPCFNGRWSRTERGVAPLRVGDVSLNPCFNGRWSRTGLNSEKYVLGDDVLILVLMEDGLVRHSALTIQV